MAKINLGCAEDIKEGYINIDIYPIDPRVMKANALELPFKSESIDEIYCCHFMEHLTLEELDKGLTEWNRVLKIGGNLVIIVPDMDVISILWGKATPEAKLHYWNHAIYGSHRGPFQDHKTAFDYSILSGLMPTYKFEVGPPEVKSYSFWLGVTCTKKDNYGCS